MTQEQATRSNVSLTIDNLVKSYGKRQVVNGISFSVGMGEIVGLLGPNGAGKTTTFYMIVGLIRPDSGKIIYDGRDITRLHMYMRARKGIGYLSQESSIFRGLTVEENLMAILELIEKKKKVRKDRLEETLSDFGLSGIRKNFAYNLSGGERRRVEIARALLINPLFMLLDEPFSGIDPIAVEGLQEIIFRLKQRKIGIIITDHNVRETLAITDRSYIMYEGKILISGTSKELEISKQAKDIYLGERFRL